MNYAGNDAANVSTTIVLIFCYLKHRVETKIKNYLEYSNKIVMIWPLLDFHYYLQASVDFDCMPARRYKFYRNF